MSITPLSDRLVVCRTSHQCAWCGELLDKGEQARYRSYIFSDEMQNDWQHPECYAAMYRVPQDELRDGFLPGDFLRGSVEWA